MNAPATRVCIMLPAHWSSILGGAELQVRYLMDRLVQRSNVEVFYLCRHSATDACDQVTILKLTHARLMSRYVQFVDHRQAMALLNEIQPHIIYARVGSAYVGMAARYCRHADCKLVWHIAHEKDVTPHPLNSARSLIRLPDRWLFEYGVRHADAIIGQAQYQDELLAASFRRRCTVVTPNFHPAPETVVKDTDVVRVVWAANVKAVKRPDVFLALARRLGNHSRLRFVMIGAIQDDNWEGRLERELEELDNLTYLGLLTPEEVNDQLAQSHIFVNTSETEGFPNTFVQAWLRKAVVVSLSVDPDGVLSSGGLGVLSGSIDKLVDDVKALADDDATRCRLAEACLRYAEENHSMANADKLVDLMLDLRAADLESATKHHEIPVRHPQQVPALRQAGERNHTRRRCWHTSVSGHVAAVEAASAGLRQAHDLLPAHDPHAGGYSGDSKGREEGDLRQIRRVLGMWLRRLAEQKESRIDEGHLSTVGRGEPSLRQLKPGDHCILDYILTPMLPFDDRFGVTISIRH